MNQSLAHVLSCSCCHLALVMKEVLVCHDTATGFLQTSAPHPGKWCRKEGKGATQSCTISGVWILEKKFSGKLFQCVFSPHFFFLIFFSLAMV